MCAKFRANQLTRGELKFDYKILLRQTDKQKKQVKPKKHVKSKGKYNEEIKLNKCKY